jgi:hypothetical protein
VRDQPAAMAANERPTLRTIKIEINDALFTNIPSHVLPEQFVRLLFLSLRRTADGNTQNAQKA